MHADRLCASESFETRVAAWVCPVWDPRFLVYFVLDGSDWISFALSAGRCLRRSDSCGCPAAYMCMCMTITPLG
jgi:hypothetical protein